MSVTREPEQQATRGDPVIVLASSSPRRKEILAQIGVRFRSAAVNVDECPEPGEPARDYVCRVAGEKSQAGVRLCGDHLPVLAADTEVVLDGEIFGKPLGFEHARSMLLRLSGRAHRVVSAVSLRHGERHWLILSESRVLFRDLRDEEIEAYWACGEPQDKAGAYAIQGRGALFVRRLEGSFSGVMGLPIVETAELLAQVGIEPSTLSHVETREK